MSDTAREITEKDYVEFHIIRVRKKDKEYRKYKVGIYSFYSPNKIIKILKFMNELSDNEILHKFIKYLREQ